MTTGINWDEHRHTIETEVGRISYLDVGSGPVALFIHGVFTNGLLWRNCMTELSGNHRCIAIDLPGHGSTPPVEDASVWGLAEAVALLIKNLELTGIHLVGNDTGGAVAQVVIVRDPDRFRSFTLTNCDTEGNFPPTAFKPIVALSRVGLLHLFKVGLRFPRVARQIFRMGYRRPGALPTDVVLSYLRPIVGSPSGMRFMARLLDSMQPDQLSALRPGLGRLTVPTLIVWGTGDVFFRTRWARWLAELIPGATEVVRIPGGRLHFVDDHAADLVPELENHWA